MVELQERLRFSVYPGTWKPTSNLLSLPACFDTLLSPGATCWRPAKVVRTVVVDPASATPSVLRDTAARVQYVGLESLTVADADLI
jgi:hypothetical protein